MLFERLLVYTQNYAEERLVSVSNRVFFIKYIFLFHFSSLLARFLPSSLSSWKSLGRTFLISLNCLQMLILFHFFYIPRLLLVCFTVSISNSNGKNVLICYFCTFLNEKREENYFDIAVMSSFQICILCWVKKIWLGRNCTWEFTFY